MPLRAHTLQKTLIAAVAFLSGIFGVGEYLIHGTSHPTYLFVIPALLLAVGILAAHMYSKEWSTEKKNKHTFE